MNALTETQNVDYRFEIYGPEIPLRRLAEDLQTEQVVTMWQEDGPEENEVPGYRWFRTVLTKGCSNREEAAQAGEELVALLNGAVSVLHPELRIVRSPAFTPETMWPDEHADAEPVPEQVELRKPPLFRVERIFADLGALHYDRPAVPEYWLFRKLAKQIGFVEHQSGRSQILKMLSLAIDNESDYALLKHAGSTLNWDIVYKLRDTLQHVGAGTLSKTQLSKIGNTANNFDVSKFDARHGLTGIAGEPTKVISLEQGAEWVLTAVQKYLLPRTWRCSGGRS